MKVLKRTEFGEAVLREKARELSVAEIKSQKLQTLIKDMRHTLSSLKLGVGLAAPQVGESIALSVIAIQPTPHRPKAVPFDLVIINPVVTETFGRKKQMWEGCISAGPGKAGLFAKVPRYKKVKIKFIDETGKSRHEVFEDLQAHVMQHEIDHLNGTLFVDKVKDTKTYTTYKEYMKIVKATSKTNK
jgi:peptide deformylase